MSETKTLSVEIKDADQGTVEAVFATLNVIDHDGDVTLPGAFKTGQEVKISAYNHGSWSGSLPVGKGVIREHGDKAILDGQFFLNTSAGRDTFTVVKELGPLQQWSYGFDVEESEAGQHEEKDVRFLKALDVYEVSPVLLGAGVGTTTMSVKEAKEIADIPLLDTDTTFADQAESLLGDAQNLVARAQAFGSRGTGQKAGRTLSQANRERLLTLHTSLQDTMAELASLLEETDPDKDRNELIREFARLQHGIAATR